MEALFSDGGGYRWLDSWALGRIIQLGTHRFCEAFLTHKLDPTGRQYDQMTQAAHAGCINIIEGSERGAISSETEMRLADVARTNLAALRGDYVFWLLRKKLRPWKKVSDEAKAVYAVQLDPPAHGADVLHDSCDHLLKQLEKFSAWMDSYDDVIVANTLIILITRTINSHLEAQDEMFKKDGVFREYLKEARTEELYTPENTPVCPECDSLISKKTYFSNWVKRA